MKQYQIFSLLLLVAAAVLIQYATASDLGLSGTSSVISGKDFKLFISGWDLLGTVTLSMMSCDRPVAAGCLRVGDIGNGEA